MQHKITCYFYLIFLISFLLQPNHTQAQTTTFEKGSLTITEGIPVLTVKGNPHEVGVQYGTLLNDQLVEMYAAIDSLMDHHLGTNFIKRGITNMVIKKKIKKWRKRMPYDFLDEFQGIAYGSDLTELQVNILAYFPQLFFDISCSAFIIKDDDQLIHGRNLDWPGISLFAEFPLIVNYEIEGKKPYTSITYMGYPAMYTGINHEGVSISINMNSAPAEEGKKEDDYNVSMPVAYKTRHILEKAKNISDVDKVLKGYSSHSWFLTVGSENDNSGAIYELTRGKIIKNSMADDFLFVENLSISDVGRYMYSPINMHNTFNIGREKKIQELYDLIQTNDLVEKTHTILSNTEYYNYPHNPSFGASINNSITVISTILDNKNLDIYFSFGGGLSAWEKYFKYNINTNQLSVFKEPVENSDKELLMAYGDFYYWYTDNYNGKKIKEDDREVILSRLQDSKMDAGHRAYLLSYHYRKGNQLDQSLEYANEYIQLYPEYYHTYYNKYLVLSARQEYDSSISALKNMMQTETLPVYYEYRANVEMAKTMNKMMDDDPTLKDKIIRCVDKANDLAKQYYIDERIGKELKELDNILSKLE